MTNIRVEDRHEVLIESIIDWLWEIDKNGVFTYSSPQIKSILGYSPEEVIGLTPFDLMPKNEAIQIAEKFQSISKNRHPIKALKNYNRHKDGYLVLLETSGNPFYDEDGEYAGYRGIDREISNTKSVGEEQTTYQELLDTLEEATISTSPDGIILFINNAFCKLMGYEKEEVLGKNVSMIDPDDVDDIEKVSYAIEKLEKDDRLKHRRWRKKKNGDLINVSIKGKSVRNEYGQVIRLVGCYAEVTNEKELKDLLDNSEESYHDLFAEMEQAQRIAKVGSWTLDLQTDEHTWSEQLFNIYGRSSKDGTPTVEEFSSMMNKASWGKLTKAMDSAIEKGTCYDLELKINRFDGAKAWILSRGEPVIGENGKVEKLRGVVVDITNQKENENLKLEHAAQLSKALTETANVASDISAIRDPYTHDHETRVSEICVAIASEMELNSDFIEGIRIAGQLHDIGKIGLPTETLTRPGKLTKSEYELIKAHAKSSFDILKPISFPWPIAEMAFQHHERMDGSGYPQGLKGDEILIGARIMAAADVIEAMSSHRPYRPALGVEKALEEIERGRGSLYDENVANACLKIFREKNYSIPD